MSMMVGTGRKFKANGQLPQAGRREGTDNRKWSAVSGWPRGKVELLTLERLTVMHL